MAEQDPLVGKVLADRFEILERIGEGGTGVVYRAKQVSVDRIVAIKILGAHVSTDPSWVKRFHNEARAASRLDHPNTIRLFDFGQTKDGLLFIAMEFLNGKSLRTEIDRVQRLPPNRVLRILSQACASLHEAHTQGIIHRDIKPDNIYLVDMKGAGDFVKVLDFSVAKLDAPDAQVTRAGIVFGTPAYMSPEQGRGVQLDARSDIYALGIVAYEMLTGKPPFDAKIPTEVVMMHLREQPKPLQGVPPQLANIVMRALSKDPKQRPQSAEAMDQECQAAYAELFPRQTPGSGSHQQLGYGAPVQQQQQVGFAATLPPPMAPPMGQPPDQRTMMAGGPAPKPQAGFAATVEQKTMMAMEAPQVPARPLSGPPPGQEQKTMMAGMGAPSGLPPLGQSGLPPLGGGQPFAPMGNSAGSEQKTMMAGMGAPSPPMGAQSAGSEQKTMMAGMNAPVIPQQTSLNAQKTMAVSAPSGNTGAGTALPNLGAGTQILPDSAGVVAFAREQAALARQQSQAEDEVAEPAGALFWVAWVVIGVGAGLGMHFFGVTQKLGF